MKPLLAIDTETHLIRDLGAKVRTDYHVPRLVVISLARGEEQPWLEYPDALEPACFESMLEKYTWVGHNISFDLAVLAREWPDLREPLRQKCLRREILDTRILFQNRWADYAGPRTLANLARIVLGEEIEKGAVRTSFRRGEPLTQEQQDYAKQDAEITLRLATTLIDGYSPRRTFSYMLHSVGGDHSSLHSSDKLYSAASAIRGLGVESRGLAVDVPVLRELSSEAEATVDQHLRELVDAGLARWKRRGGAPITNRGPVSTLVCDHRAWRPSWAGSMRRRWKGNLEEVAADITLDTKAIRAAYQAVIDTTPGEWDDLPDPTETGLLSLEYDYWKTQKDLLPEKLRSHLALGKQRKLLSTYYRPLLEKVAGQECASGVTDLRRIHVYPNLGIGATETNRWSAWKPNLQNQPKAIRYMYRAPTPGHVIVGADYPSLEIYTLCEAMAALGIHGPVSNMLSTGRDLHTHTASLLFSIEEADVTPEQRQAAKSTNFGVPGGLGPRKLAALARRQYGLSWDVETAREMKFRWLDVFHDVAEYFKCFKVDPWELRRYGLTKRQFAEELGLATEPWPDWRELTDAMGKGKFFEVTLPTGRRSPPRRYTQAMNFFFQGLGADTITEAYLRCEAAGLAVIAVVHDSVSCEAAPDQAEEVARQLSHCMEEALAEICPNVPRAVVKSEIKSHWF
jgi:hypothetical protein